MFTPFDRNSAVGPESVSNRGNAPARFSPGMSSLGDENQIRIQLAVHKYNSLGGNPIAGRRSLISPAKHSFLKNATKRKICEEDAETAAKNEKKRGNQYEGVGAFPTVHLKKNAVLYRPIRRHNEVKVPYPELPVNRFLNHFPELCSDSKSSTRSVLDVLQNLSGKSIHSKEENDCSKSKSKGLGGDLTLDADSVYKPLFVQRPNLKAILTRDSTTQTLLSPSLEGGSRTQHESNSNGTSCETPDPKAEIRRKLARKNNEIFASLSSSVLFSGSKRKIDKVAPLKDDIHLNDSPGAKKQKLFENHNSVTEGKGTMVNGSKSTANDYPTKLSRKSILNDSNSTSPNKDRLTTIYLDMKSTSPKNVAFQSMSTSTNDAKNSTEGKPSEEPSSNSKSGDKPSFSFNTGPSFNFKPNELSKSPNINFSSPIVPSEPSKTESVGQTNGVSFLSKPVENSQTIAPAEPKTSTVPTFSFGIPSATTSPSWTSENKLTGSNDKLLASTTANAESKTAQPENNAAVGKTSEEVPKTSFGTGFKFGNSEAFKGFQFSSGDSKPQTSESISKPTTSEGGSNVVATTSSTVPQFTFGVNNAKASQPSSTVVFGTTSTSAENKNQPFKPMFSFGQSPLNTSTENKSSEGGDKPSPSVSFPTKETAQPSLFGEKAGQPTGGLTFGKTTNVESPGKEASDAQKDPPPASSGFTLPQPVSTSQSPNLSTAVTSLGSTFPQSSASSGLTTGNGTTSLFTFGQKPATSTSTSVANTEKPAFSFGFQAKPAEASQTKVSEAKGQEQKAPQPLFSFGQKTTQESTVGTSSTVQTSAPTSAPQPTTLFAGTANASQEKEKSQIPAFAQNQNSTQQPSNAFATKTETTSFGQTSAPSTFSFSAKPPTFGAASTSAQSTPAFGSSASTTQSNIFGTSAQPTMSFGVSAPSQATPAFGAPAMGQTGIGFGASAPQSTSGFGNPTASQAPTQSTAPFGSGFGAPASSQPSTGFGAPAPSQPSTGFGAPTGGFGGLGSTPQTSFQQPFGQNKSSTSLAPTSNIFGQSTATPVSSSGFAPSSSSSFNSSPGQTSIFGQKTAAPANIFGQPPKMQSAPLFGQNTTTPAFGTQNKFAFGMSTSNNTDFTTSPPSTTTAAPAFSFGGSASSQASTFNFGSGSSSGTTSTDSPFAFKGATNEAFKFGASTTKEGPGFGATSTFTFGAAQPTAISTSEVKPPATNFNFGSAPTSSAAPGFGFGATQTPSPSVFSFGGSGSSVSSGSSFNFGTPQPGGPFSQASTPSPFAVPGTFSIGSGSSQSRPRASSRLRRRP